MDEGDEDAGERVNRGVDGGGGGDQRRKLELGVLGRG